MLAFLSPPRCRALCAAAAPAISQLHLAFVEKLAKAKTLDQVEQFVELAPINLLNASACATALRQLGSFGSTNARVIDRVITCAEPLKFKPAQLRDVLHGINFGKLKPTLPPAFVDKTLACREFEEFTGEDFALLFDSLDDAEAAAARSKDLLSRLGEELCKRKNCKEFAGNELALIAHNAIVKYGMVDHALVPYLSRDIVKRKTLSTFQPDDFGLLLQSFALVRDVALFDKIGKYLCKYPERMDEFLPMDFIVILRAFKDMEEGGESDELKDVRTRLHSKMAKQICANPALLQSFARTGYEMAMLLKMVKDYELAASLSDEIVNLSSAAEEGGGGVEYSLEELASILSSLSRHEKYNRDAVQVLYNALLGMDLRDADAKLLESIHDSLHELDFVKEDS